MAGVIWFTGLACAGKTTLATKLKEEFENCGIRPQLLDGDEVREIFGGDLGYSRSDRIMNVKRIAFASMLLAENGTNAIVANIAPFYEVRDFIRRITKTYLQVYVIASLDTLKERDKKSLYVEHRDPNSGDVIGVDDQYDVPRNPDVIVDTDQEMVVEAVERIIRCCRMKGIL
jgi:adenylylsulfate kinase